MRHGGPCGAAYAFGEQRAVDQHIDSITKTLDTLLVEHGYGNRFQGFQNLMRLRIRDVLLVSSLYDLYLFEEDGRLYELISNEYQGFNLSHSPELTRVSSGKEAIALAREERRFDLVITTLHIDDMPAVQFARMVRESGLNIPIVLLAHDNRELKYLLLKGDTSVFDKVFIWQGDFRIIIAIIKSLEDRINVDHDTRMVGVQTVLVIEDSVRFYSSILPIIYTEILKQSQRLISEGINLTHKFLRMRARPKILLCSTYEEAWTYFQEYREFTLGIISDIDFPRDGTQDPRAGIEFARAVKSRAGGHPAPPHVEHARQRTGRARRRGVVRAERLADDAERSPAVHGPLVQLRRFRLPHAGRESRWDAQRISAASRSSSRSSPKRASCTTRERNHFSNWLKARTEFWLAHQLRPRKVSDYPSVEALRSDLIQSLHNYRNIRQRGIIADFTKETFDPDSSFARIGGGSLGGKARGLGFVSTLINDYNVRNRFDGVIIYVPPAVVLGTDVFDQFVDENKLRKFALTCGDDTEITRRFVEAPQVPRRRARGAGGVSRPDARAPRGPLLQPSRRFPVPPVCGGVRDVHAPEQACQSPRPAERPPQRREEGVCLHVLPERERLHQGDLVPPGGGENGGHHTEDGRGLARARDSTRISRASHARTIFTRILRRSRRTGSSPLRSASGKRSSTAGTPSGSRRSTRRT